MRVRSPHTTSAGQRTSERPTPAAASALGGAEQ